jgi:hypothetical protein
MTKHSRPRRKNKGFRNKDPKYFEKLGETKKEVRWFTSQETKKQLGVENGPQRKNPRKGRS